MPRINTELPPAFDLGEDREEYIPDGYGSGAGNHPFETPLRLEVENTQDDYLEGNRFQFRHSLLFRKLILIDVFLIIVFLRTIVIEEIICSVSSFFLIIWVTFLFVNGVSTNSKKQFQRISNELFDGQSLRMSMEFSRKGMKIVSDHSNSFLKWSEFRIIDKPIRYNDRMLLFFTSAGQLFQIIPKRALPQGLTVERLAADLERAIANEKNAILEN